MYDIVIIGAGCAGLTAAIYAKRAGMSVLVLEGEMFGGQIVTSPHIENYPGIMSISGCDIAEGLLNQAKALGAEVKLDRVLSILPGDMKVITESSEYQCKSVIIATGTTHRLLGIDREKEFIGSGVSYCAVCDGAFFKNRRVAVVGGGNTALGDALYLSGYCSEVLLIHRRGEYRADDALRKAVSEKANIKPTLNSVITKLVGDNALSAVRIKNLLTGEETEAPLDGVFVAIGQLPQNRIFEKIIKLDDEGYIIASEDCATSCVGVFAAGDCRTKQLRQLTTAAADGAVAATNACKFAKRQKS